MLRSYKKEGLIRILEELSDEQFDQVFTFALFVKGRKAELKTVSAARIASLSGLVSWGGDAVEDAERIYE
ncbi:MAG: hypothetical protein R2941_07290 [Desulfobacterales bacterium]